MIKVEKYSDKVLAISASLEIVLTFLINTILSLDLFFSEKSGLAVCQNFLLSVIFFSLRFGKYCFFSFLKRDTHKLRYIVKIYPFCL